MHRLTIWLIAIVFVFNGAAVPTWIDLPAAAPTLTVDSDHGVSVRDVAQSDHDSDRDSAMAATLDHGQSVKHIDKCCVTCSTASMVPDAVVTAVIFSSVAIKFHAAQTDMVGHLVALDPDIPKLLV